MKAKIVPSPLAKIKMYIGYVFSALGAVIYTIIGNWSGVAIFVFLGIFGIVIDIRTNSICKREFVFDETGIKVFYGEKIKKFYKWSSVYCIYYANDSLSEKERKKLERSLIPCNPKIRILDFSEKVISKNTSKHIIDVFLVDDEAKLFDFFVSYKHEFLSKMDEWGVSLHSPNE